MVEMASTDPFGPLRCSQSAILAKLCKDIPDSPSRLADSQTMTEIVLGVAYDALELTAISTDNSTATLTLATFTEVPDGLSDMTVRIYNIAGPNVNARYNAVIRYTRYYLDDVTDVANRTVVDVTAYRGPVDINNAIPSDQTAPVATIDDLGNPVFEVIATFGYSPMIQARILVPAIRVATLSVRFTRSVPLAEIKEAVDVDTTTTDTNLGKGCCDCRRNQLTVNWTTDALGGSLAEIVMAISAPTRYVGGYCSKWIARNRNLRIDNVRCSHRPPRASRTTSCAKITFFAFRPRIFKTLDGCGDYDLLRIIQLHKRYNITLPLEAFYIDVLSYTTLKYCLAGLITGTFDIAWLYQSQNAAFFELLANSEFASLLPQFLPYLGYERFFLWF
jgi:hypothetical protein